MKNQRYLSKYRSVLIVLVFQMLFSVILCGCFSSFKKDHISHFSKRSKDYERSLIWGSYRNVAKFHKITEENQTLSQIYQLKKYKITSYSVISTTKKKHESDIKQIVEIVYYDRDKLIENSVIDQQVWEFNPDAKTWFLTSGLPNFSK